MVEDRTTTTATAASYAYWNLGLNLAFWEKPTFSLDIRYWDTDLDGCSDAQLFQCDERVVGTIKAFF